MSYKFYKFYSWQKTIIMMVYNTNTKKLRTRCCDQIFSSAKQQVTPATIFSDTLLQWTCVWTSWQTRQTKIVLQLETAPSPMLNANLHVWCVGWSRQVVQLCWDEIKCSKWAKLGNVLSDISWHLHIGCPKIMSNSHELN